MLLNYQNAYCSLKNKFIVLFIIIFGTLSFSVRERRAVPLRRLIVSGGCCYRVRLAVLATCSTVR